jgi:hypothetical protein
MSQHMVQSVAVLPNTSTIPETACFYHNFVNLKIFYLNIFTQRKTRHLDTESIPPRSLRDEFLRSCLSFFVLVGVVRGRNINSSLLLLSLCDLCDRSLFNAYGDGHQNLFFTSIPSYR